MILALLACSHAPELPAAVPGPFDHAYTAWDAALRANVRDGRVDYPGIAPALDGVLAALATPTAEDVASWTHDEQMAFWINSYNAWTLRVVLDHPGIGSIKDIGVVPYAAFRAPVAHLRARDAVLSLDDIEKRELLGGLCKDEPCGPVVHMAVSCASASCPALQPRAWRADDLDATFEAAARGFLADPQKNRVEGDTLQLSRIFDWYAADFVRAAGSVDAWVARYGPAEMAAVASGPHTSGFLEYDWSLNAQGSPSR